MTDMLGGGFHLGDREVPRLGYGAMRLSGPGVFGPPKDRDEAIAVLRTAVELGVRHIDTADFYGPHVTNELIREALSPYPDDLVIVTKVGNVRDAKGGWPVADSPEQLRQQVHDNLQRLGLDVHLLRLGLDVLDVVNLRNRSRADRSTPLTGSIAERFEALAELREEGLIKHLGVSTVGAQQIAEARTIAPIVCVQNMYNLAQRADEDLLAQLADDEIAYVPYFPLGGFSPLQSAVLSSTADRLGASTAAVASAWLLQHAPNILLIPGTSSVEHLRDNVAAASLQLDETAIADLDAVAA